MKVTMIIPDKDYARIMKSACRMRCSLGMISPTMVDARLYADRKRSNEGVEWKQLEHGRVSLNRLKKKVSLSMRMDLNESGLCVWKQMEKESYEACNFLYTRNLKKRLK